MRKHHLKLRKKLRRAPTKFSYNNILSMALHAHKTPGTDLRPLPPRPLKD